MILALIAAMSDNRVIGRDGDLPWHYSEDLKHFKRTTKGHTIIMGRKTWESIGRVLPHRRHIVLTRQKGYEAPGCEVVSNLQDAIDLAERSGDAIAFVIGGQSVYAEALPKAHRIHLTRVPGTVDGDTWFPEFEDENWALVEDTPRGELRFEVWERA